MTIDIEEEVENRKLALQKIYDFFQADPSRGKPRRDVEALIGSLPRWTAVWGYLSSKNFIHEFKTTQIGKKITDAVNITAAGVDEVQRGFPTIDPKPILADGSIIIDALTGDNIAYYQEAQEMFMKLDAAVSQVKEVLYDLVAKMDDKEFTDLVEKALSHAWPLNVLLDIRALLKHPKFGEKVRKAVDPLLTSPRPEPRLIKGIE